MKDISGIPNVDVATANLINGEMKDVATPGDGTGTPVRVDWQSDLYYALIAIMNEAGITADNTAEGATSSQVKDAILRVARKQVQGPSYDELNVSRPSTSTVLITFDKMWIEGIEKTSGSYLLNIANSGALGLDTGVENNDAWYYCWLIAKVDGTVSAILSLSSTAPTMPAGYTLKRRVSCVRNTSGNFVDFKQRNNKYFFDNYTVLSGGSSATYAAVDVSVRIPYLITDTIYGYTQTELADALQVDLSPDGILTYTSHRVVGATHLYASFVMPILTTNIYYKVNTSNTTVIRLSGFDLNI